VSITPTDDRELTQPAPMPEGDPPTTAGTLGRVSVRDQDGVAVASITGEVDISNVDEIAEPLLELPNLALGLIVDLTAVEYLDSTGISLLHDLAGRLYQRSQGLIIVCPPTAPPRRVLELTGVDARAPIVDDVAAAIAAIRDDAGAAPPF
jgi:anti-anti-sigma factor